MSGGSMNERILGSRAREIEAVVIAGSAGGQ